MAEVNSVARGSGVAIFGTLINRVVRLLNTWQLSNALDVYNFGLYTSITTIVSILAFFGPLGMNSGITLFGSRYMASGEQGKLKGALFTCFGGAAIGGVLVSAVYFAVTQIWPWSADKADLGALMPYAAFSIIAWSVLLVAVNSLRVAHDAVAQASVFNVTLPVLLLVFSWAATSLGWGVKGTLVVFGIAHLLAFIEGMVRNWRHFGPLVMDASIVPEYEIKAVLKFSIPESLSYTLYRLTQWMDQLQLTIQSTPDQVGIFKVASSLASVGSVPAAALQTIFNSTAAELLYSGDKDKMATVLGIVTRWITVLAAAAYLGIVLSQDLVYALFDPAYGLGSSSLVALMVGQLVLTSCVPVTTLIPMAGYARLNLINGVLATLLNIGLNLVLIPVWGSVGASISTATTLILWSGWRVVQVKKLMGYFPFTWGTVVLHLGTIGLAWALRLLISGTGLWVHGSVAVGSVAVFLGLAWRFGRQPEDDLILAPLVRKVRRVLRRGRAP